MFSGKVDQNEFFETYKRCWGRKPDRQTAKDLGIAATTFSSRKNTKWFITKKITDIQRWFKKHNLKFGEEYLCPYDFTDRVREANPDVDDHEIRYYYSEYALELANRDLMAMIRDCVRSQKCQMIEEVQKV